MTTSIFPISLLTNQFFFWGVVRVYSIHLKSTQTIYCTRYKRGLQVLHLLEGLDLIGWLNYMVISGSQFQHESGHNPLEWCVYWWICLVWTEAQLFLWAPLYPACRTMVSAFTMLVPDKAYMHILVQVNICCEAFTG